MANRPLLTLVAALFLAHFHSSAQAQGRGLIVPSAASQAASATAPSPVRQTGPVQSLAQVDPAQQRAAAAQVSAAIASARDQALSPSAAAPASPRPRPVIAEKTAPGAPSPAQQGSSTNPTAAAGPSDQTPRPTVQKRADGSQVFRTPVTAAMVQEEERLAASDQPPGVPAGRGQGSSPPPATPSQAKSASPLATFLGTGPAALPKWATDGVSRTNGKTRLVVSQGVTEMVTIARNFPNRFITPFESAEVVTTDDSLAHDGVGGSVILSTSSDKPIGIFIQDRFSDRSIALVLMPEDVPQRELRLVLDDTWVAPVLRPNPDAPQIQMPSAQSDFVEFLKSTLRALAKGEVPDGHALTPLDPEQVPRCQVPGLALKPAQMLEGPTTRVAVYIANNPTEGTLPFQEAGCYRRGVLAVSAFPRPVLEAGQSTEVYVVLRKEVATQTATGKRRPVLVAQ